jgi:hypothetical protein
MGGNELEVLEHYNRKIQKYGEHKDATEILLKCLIKLDQVRVNISLLQVDLIMQKRWDFKFYFLFRILELDAL